MEAADVIGGKRSAGASGLGGCIKAVDSTKAVYQGHDETGLVVGSGCGFQ